MTARPIFDYMPDIYQQFFPSVFNTTIPDETATTCADCAMWESSDGSSSQHITYSKESKCCTHYPNISNYLVGAILEDDTPAMDAGKSLLRKELERRTGTLPHGLFQPRIFDFLKRHAPSAFGRSSTLICPFFERDAGICTLWPYRSAVCGTWFCKYIDGEDGRQFWKSVRRFLEYAEKCLGRYALMKAGWPSDSILFSLPSDAQLTPDDIDEKPMGQDMYNRLWYDYAGREEEWYRKSYQMVKAITHDEFSKITGVDGLVYINDILSKHEKIAPDTIPQVLMRNPSLKVIDIDNNSHTIVGYSPLDPVRLTNRVYGLLDAFDGKKSTTEIINQRLGQELPVPEDDLILTLYRYRFLVDSAIS